MSERVNEWFLRFEKKAHEYQWPGHRWAALVSNVLKGKALDAYDRLEVQDVLKEAVLKAYELRPEAYRLAFRGARKRQGDSHVEFARYLHDTLASFEPARRPCRSTGLTFESVLAQKR